MGLLDVLTGGRPEDRFAKLVLAELKRQDPASGWRYKRDRFSIVAEATDVEAFLGNVFYDYRQCAGAEQAELIADYVRMVIGGQSEADLSFEDATPRLMPLVRNIAHLLNQPSPPDSSEAFRPLIGPLGVLLAIDSPRSLSVVAQDTLQRWGVGFDEALAVALDNLRARSPSKFVLQEEGYYQSQYEDYFDASRVLLPELFEDLPLEGEPVAIVIDRTCVAVTGSRQLEALAALAAAAEAAIDELPRSIAYTPITLRDGQWREFEVDGAELPEMQRLRIKQQISDASGQSDALETLIEARGEDLRLAALLVHEHEGRAITFSQIRDRTLLPRVDVLLLPGPRGDGLMARRWEDVETALDGFIPYAGAYPPRYAVELPSEVALTRLKADYACPAGFEGFETDEGFVSVVSVR